MSDCPICFDVIDDTHNIVITYCRHKFHATCLFRSVQSGGYRCPNCRGCLLYGPIMSPTGVNLTGATGRYSLYDDVISTGTTGTGTTGTGATGTGATGRFGIGRASLYELYDISWNNINAMVQDAPTDHNGG